MRARSRIVAVLAAHARHPAAGSLQDQTDDIAGDENGGIATRLHPAAPQADRRHDVAQGEVDGGAEEGGRDGETADLDQEAVLREGVVVRYDAPRVADDFGDAAEHGGDPEGALPREDALDGVADAGEGEEGEEAGVGAERGLVGEDGLFEGAGAEGADDVFVGHGGGGLMGGKGWPTNTIGR